MHFASKLFVPVWIRENKKSYYWVSTVSTAGCTWWPSKVGITPNNTEAKNWKVLHKLQIQKVVCIKNIVN